MLKEKWDLVLVIFEQAEMLDQIALREIKIFNLQRRKGDFFHEELHPFVLEFLMSIYR